jgi:hypothetical protein
MPDRSQLDHLFGFPRCSRLEALTRFVVRRGNDERDAGMTEATINNNSKNDRNSIISLDSRPVPHDYREALRE